MTMRCQKLIYGLRGGRAMCAAMRCAAGGTQPNCVGTKIHWKIVKQTISKNNTEKKIIIIIKDGRRRRWRWRGDVRKDLWQQIICERELHKCVESDDAKRRYTTQKDCNQRGEWGRGREEGRLENKQSRLFFINLSLASASNKKWH